MTCRDIARLLAESAPLPAAAAEHLRTCERCRLLVGSPAPYSGPASLDAELEKRLVALVTSDLAAVRPLSSPWVYTAALLAIAAVVVAAGVARLGVRGWLATSIFQKFYFVTLLTTGIAACAAMLSQLMFPGALPRVRAWVLGALAIAAALGAGTLYPLLRYDHFGRAVRDLFQHRNGPCSRFVYRCRIHPAARFGAIAPGRGRPRRTPGRAHRATRSLRVLPASRRRALLAGTRHSGNCLRGARSGHSSHDGSPEELTFPRTTATLSYGMTKGNTADRKTSEVLQGTLDLMVLKTLDALGPLHGYGIAPPHRTIEPGSAAIERGHRVHRFAAPPPAGLDHFGMGRIGKQSPGEVLFNYTERPQATRE